MAKIRIGLGSEFNLKDQKVGLGTNNPQERLDVAGVAKGKDLKVTGISSFTAYEGFLRADHQIAENTTLSFDQGPSASLSGEIIVGTGQTITVTGVGLGTTTVGNGSGTIENTIDTTDVTRAGGSEIECLKVYNTFTPPSGGTNQRPYAPKPGELYYNYDFKTIEFHDGYGWRQVDNTTTAGRVVIASGRTPGVSQIMEYVNIMTLGNTQDFGTLSGTARRQSGGLANSIRGLNAGGQGPSANINDIDYFTMASGGTTADFGNLTGGAKQVPAGASSSTRGLFMGGGESGDTPVDDIDYCEIMTTGDTIDFGNLSVATRANNAYSSPTRAVKCGGQTPSTQISILDTVTIASTGNAIEYGDLTQIRRDPGTCANSVRGLIAAGSGGGFHKSIDVSTIATGGNCTDFGDCTTVGNSLAVGSAGNSTRGLFIFGTNPDSNVINYVTLATSGDAIDFGDVSGTLGQQGCCSDSHGGLGGF